LKKVRRETVFHFSRCHPIKCSRFGFFLKKCARTDISLLLAQTAHANLCIPDRIGYRWPPYLLISSRTRKQCKRYPYIIHAVLRVCGVCVCVFIRCVYTYIHIHIYIYIYTVAHRRACVCVSAPNTVC